MAVAHTSKDSVTALAGINSSMAEQKRDNNQHLRSFRLDLPTESKGNEKKEGEVTTTVPADSILLSRESLFRTKGAKAGSDTYQRIVRLSPYRTDASGAESPRVGAITTGLAPSGEIVFFQATSTPREPDVIGRIHLSNNEEAEDVDIIGLGKEKEKDVKLRAAYTNGIDVFTCQFSSKTRGSASPGVNHVYTTPLPEEAETRSRPKFRALRFLSPTSLLLLQNAPDRSGCELLVLTLPSSNEKKSATIVRRKKLRKTVKIGLGLDVCNLGASADNQQQQSIIAVTGSDLSIEILTLDYDSRQGHGYGKIKPYTTLRDVHPFSVTKICFSNFIPPTHPVTPEIGSQYVKLASVSMGNTIVVHTLPLSPFPASSRTPRYVLSVRGGSESWTNLLSGFTALLSILVVCIAIQGVLEIRGGSPSYLGAEEWVPVRLRDVVGQSALSHPVIYDEQVIQSPSSSATATTTISIVPNTPQPSPSSLRDILLSRQQTDPETTPQSNIIVRCSTNDKNDDTNAPKILIETLFPSTEQPEPENKDANPHPWEHLTDEQKTLWKTHLIDAGHWAVGEGESILQGVLFAEYCGFIGGLVRDELP